jgi:hypothetical protein
MSSLRRLLGVLSIAAGTLVGGVGGAGCGGSDAPPPEDPTSVDTSPRPVGDAPPPTGGTSTADAPKPRGDEPAGSGAPPASQSETPAASPTPEPAKTAEPAAPPPSVVGSQVEGTIASRKGTVLVINTTGGGSAPAAGSKWSLFRYFEQKVGPFNTTGWLGIADVTVKGANGGRLELTIDAEKSEIMVNGKKVNHFAAGIRVKLEPPK